MQGLRRFGQFGLSTRIILSMAGVVFLTAIASVVIFNIIITNRTREAENNIQKVFTQIQDYKRQNQVPVQTSIDQIKAAVNNSDLTPEAQLDQVRTAVRNSDSLNFRSIQNILRESGLPVSQGEGFREPPPPTGQTGSTRNSIIKFDRKDIENTTEWWIFSPVIQASLWGSLIAAICAVLLGFVLSRTVIRPLRALERASERIADGNYNLEIVEGGKDDVGRLARSFNKMAHALRLTEQKRKELVADVAHELRTPLSSIQGYTEVLRDGLVPSRERQEEIYNHILKEVRHLTGMVESMRVWMSNEQALEHLNLEEIPARLPAQMVVERFRPAAEQKQVSLELEVETHKGVEPQVQADSDALGHILSNLVDNSLRYTPAGGSIRLKIGSPIRLAGERRRVVWFEVHDSGEGIPAEHLPFVFERFYRVDKSRDRNTGGTGLGLAIVRDTIQALGGEVQIESESGVGTTIRFWLPTSGSELALHTRKPAVALAGVRS